MRTHEDLPKCLPIIADIGRLGARHLDGNMSK